MPLRPRCSQKRRTEIDSRDLKKRKKQDNLPERKLPNKPLKPKERRLKKKEKDSRQKQMLPRPLLKPRRRPRKRKRGD